MPVWRSMAAQAVGAIQHQGNMYGGIVFPDIGGSFVEQYDIREADMKWALILDRVIFEQARMKKE